MESEMGGPAWAWHILTGYENFDGRSGVMSKIWELETNGANAYFSMLN